MKQRWKQSYLKKSVSEEAGSRLEKTGSRLYSLQNYFPIELLQHRFGGINKKI